MIILDGVFSIDIRQERLRVAGPVRLAESSHNL